jgi:hypothetical protein
MPWTYNSNRFYAQDSDETTSAIAPRLQPLSGGSVIQSFGYDSDIRKIEAIVVGDTIKNALKALANDGMQLHTLVSPEGSLGSWALKSFSARRTDSTCQTIDITQDETAPVYDVSMEFWQET